MPKKSSRGRPVSLQVGKGMYCSWPAASVIYFAVRSLSRTTSPKNIHVHPSLYSHISNRTPHSIEGPYSHSPIQTRHRYRFSRVIATRILQALEWFLSAQRACETYPDGQKRSKKRPPSPPQCSHCKERWEMNQIMYRLNRSREGIVSETRRRVDYEVRVSWSMRKPPQNLRNSHVRPQVLPQFHEIYCIRYQIDCTFTHGSCACQILFVSSREVIKPLQHRPRAHLSPTKQTSS